MPSPAEAETIRNPRPLARKTATVSPLAQTGTPERCPNPDLCPSVWVPAHLGFSQIPPRPASSTPPGHRLPPVRRVARHATLILQRLCAPAAECPRISPAFLTAQRHLHGEALYSQEHECAFIAQPAEPYGPAAVPGYGFTELYFGIDVGKRQDHSPRALPPAAP